MDDISSFLEAALAINVFVQWKGVYQFLSEALPKVLTRRILRVGEDGAPLDERATTDDAVVRLLHRRSKFQRRLWYASRWIGVASAASIYVVLLKGFPTAYSDMYPYWLLLVGFLVPALMMLCLPCVTMYYNVRVQWRVKRDEQEEQQRKERSDEVERLVQERLGQIRAEEKRRDARRREAEEAQALRRRRRFQEIERERLPRSRPEASATDGYGWRLHDDKILSPKGDVVASLREVAAGIVRVHTDHPGLATLLPHRTFTTPERALSAVMDAHHRLSGGD